VRVINCFRIGQRAFNYFQSTAATELLHNLRSFHRFWANQHSHFMLLANKAIRELLPDETSHTCE
jgi:hypothetical protein